MTNASQSGSPSSSNLGKATKKQSPPVSEDCSTVSTPPEPPYTVAVTGNRQLAVFCRDSETLKSLRHAMTDPIVAAFLIVTGTLMQLPLDQARLRALRYVQDYFEEQSRDANQ